MGNFPDAALFFSQEIESVLASGTLFSSKIQNSKSVTVKLRHMHEVLNVDKIKKLIVQFA
jgi:hypothetical protein